VNIRNIFFIELGLIVQNWPLKINWEQNEINSFDINNYSGYDNHQIIVTGFHPPGGWFDGVCCGSGWPDMYFVLSDTSGYSIDHSRLCKYKVDFSSEEIRLLYLGFIDKTTSIEAIKENMPKIWYNKEKESISVRNTGIDKNLKVEVFNIYGSKVLFRLINNNNINHFDINISHLKNGTYIIRLYENEVNSYKISRKIVKR
jgi:hypothetical protein